MAYLQVLQPVLDRFVEALVRFGTNSEVRASSLPFSSISVGGHLAKFDFKLFFHSTLWF